MFSSMDLKRVSAAFELFAVAVLRNSSSDREPFPSRSRFCERAVRVGLGRGDTFVGRGWDGAGLEGRRGYRRVDWRLLGGSLAGW